MWKELPPAEKAPFEVYACAWLAPQSASQRPCKPEVSPTTFLRGVWLHAKCLATHGSTIPALNCHFDSPLHVSILRQHMIMHCKSPGVHLITFASGRPWQLYETS